MDIPNPVHLPTGFVVKNGSNTRLCIASKPVNPWGVASPVLLSNTDDNYYQVAVGYGFTKDLRKTVVQNPHFIKGLPYLPCMGTTIQIKPTLLSRIIVDA